MAWKAAPAVWSQRSILPTAWSRAAESPDARAASRATAWLRLRRRLLARLTAAEPRRRRPVCTSGSLGAAAVLTVFSARTPAGRTLPELSAYTVSWTVCALVSVAGAAIALLYRIPRADDTAREGR